MMAQLSLKLKPIVEESDVDANTCAALRSLYESIYMDFAGRINKSRRQGQFQYRFGVKVQPKDRKIK